MHVAQPVGIGYRIAPNDVGHDAQNQNVFLLQICFT